MELIDAVSVAKSKKTQNLKDGTASVTGLFSQTIDSPGARRLNSLARDIINGLFLSSLILS